ncbi:MAG: ATP-grasp domain-containing protein [Eubacteriales bacterium]
MFLLVGASVRALMESAVESGYGVAGIDFFGDVDALWQGNTICLKDLGKKLTVKDLLEVARIMPCDGLVYASGPENTPEELCYWENKGLLRGNGTSVLKNVRNPWKLRQCLEEINVKMPRFCSVEEWGKRAISGKWLLKSLKRGGGHGIIELPEKKNDVEELFLGLNDFNQYIIQEYIEGILGSVTFLANGQESVVLGTSRQLVGKGGGVRSFLYQGNIVPLDIKGILGLNYFEKKITEMVKHLTSTFGLKGINTVDFILNSEGIWVLEVNPRWSASVELIEKYLGKRFFKYHLKGCMEEKLPDVFPVKFSLDTESEDCYPKLENNSVWKFLGKTIVYSENTFLVKGKKEEEFHYLYGQGVRDIPQVGTIIEKGQPICTVIAKGSGDQDCLLRLQEKAQLVNQFFG